MLGITLDRYILRRFLKTFAYMTCLIGFLVCVVDFSEKNDDFLRHNLSQSLILRYYATFLPYVIGLAMPVITFISTVVMTSRMAAHSEIIAMLSSGMSFLRLLRPYAVGSCLLALLGFYLHGWLVPDGNKFRVAFEIAYVKSPFYFHERDVHFKVGDTRYVSIGSYDNSQDKAFEVTLEDIVDGQLKRRLYAQSMTWDTLQQLWVAQRWVERQWTSHAQTVFQKGDTRALKMSISPKEFKSTYKLRETFTISELRSYIAELQAKGLSRQNFYRAELYARYMYPFAMLLLTFLGVLVSARKTREGAGLLIAAGFLIAFVYIIFFVLARAMAEVGALPVAFGVWIPNILFSAIGVFLYHKLPR